MYQTNQASVITATATVVAGAGVLQAVIVDPGTTGAVDVTIYDNTAASGTKILVSRANNQMATPNTALGIAFSKGLHAVVTGTGSVTLVWG